ncbi:MAG: hypothetical protein RL078_1787 [Bacteroidota bacterium]|jgi:Rad3-related DNA helicase
MHYRSPEQTAYAKLIEGAISAGPPLLAGAAAGLGKTHGYTIPLVSSGKRVAIALSTRQLIDQFLASDALNQALSLRFASVVALESRRNFATQAQYREHKEKALQADVLVITHAAALIDSLMPSYAELRNRDVLLFDEADLLADAADLRSTFSIEHEVLVECKAAALDHIAAAKLVKENADSDEDRASASAIIYALENPAWYKEVGKDETGALILKHRMPGRMLKRLINDSPRCIFTSGTLQVSGRFDHFAKAIGINHYAPESRHIDPSFHGELNVFVASDEMSPQEISEQIVASERPVLVLTTSHILSEELGGLCNDATVRSQGEALANAVSRCPDNGILISAGAWSGLDEPRLRWRTVVIPKTPYLRPSVLDGKQVTRYLDSQVVAIRRTNQGLHRGLRTPDAKCKLLLLDPRSSRPELKEAIPKRFKVLWESFAEGSRKVRTHIVEEAMRSAALRSAALKKLGAKCSYMGCTVSEKHLLDVHHLKPIAQGARFTTLDDVVVLCKNHHAQTHHQMRLDDLQSTEDE